MKLVETKYIKVKKLIETAFTFGDYVEVPRKRHVVELSDDEFNLIVKKLVAKGKITLE